MRHSIRDFALAALFAVVLTPHAWSGAPNAVKPGVLSDMSGPYADAAGAGSVRP